MDQTRVLRETSDADARPICSWGSCAEYAHHEWRGWPMCDRDYGRALAWEAKQRAEVVALRAMGERAA